MPQYAYTAMDSKGKEQKGRINAETEAAAVAELKQKGLFPTSVKAVIAAKKAKKTGGGFNMAIGPMVIKRKELTVLTRQLAILLSAGLPLIRSLRTLERQAANPAVKSVLGRTADTVEGGATFAEALTAPTANEAFLNIADEITAVTDGKHSLTLEQTSYVRADGTESLSFNLTVEKLDAEAASIDKSALKVEWTGEQNVSSTTALVPTYSVDTESKLIVGLSVSLLTLDGKTKLEGTILIKYGNKLQRKVKITVIPKQEMIVTHTDEEPGADTTAPIATLTFTIPDTYLGSYPFNVLISTNDFNVRKSSDDQKDISLVFPGDGGYGDDNEVGYKYVYQVTQSGAHTVNLINSGIVQDIGKLTLEAELFESVDYEISLKRS